MPAHRHESSFTPVSAVISFVKFAFETHRVFRLILILKKLQNGLFAVKKPELEKEVVLVLPLRKLTLLYCRSMSAVNHIMKEF